MKIYLCTTAPSKDYKSWSNIPYLLHKNLQKKGYQVTNFVLREFSPIKFIFNLPIRFFIKYFGSKSIYFYVRTPLHFFFTYIYSQYIRIVSASDDVMIVQGFSYPPRNKKNRMLIIGDWPSSYLFEKFLKRTPGHWEMKSIEREDRVIEKADAVVTLFPDVLQYMQQKYRNKNIYYLGNVINVDEDYINIAPDILKIKTKSINLLFIGSPFYIDGANELISAAENLRLSGYELDVDIVGIEASLLKQRHNWLRIHGYLDKSVPSDKKKYYLLLENAKIFINTTPRWNAFQATLEAMYFYNPIVVRPNDNLAKTFPLMDKFTYMVDDKENNLEKQIVSSLTNNNEYIKKCNEAHFAVESFTWDIFTQKLMDLIK